MFPPLLKTKKYLFLKTWSVITPLFYKWVNIDTWMHVHLFKKLEEKQQNVNQQQTTTTTRTPHQNLSEGGVLEG